MADGSAPSSDLTGWRKAPFTGAGITYDVYEKGAGPGVVLIPEIPGITPRGARPGRPPGRAGFTVVIPSLFGTPGRAMSVDTPAGVFARLCVSAEFRAFATNARGRSPSTCVRSPATWRPHPGPGRRRDRHVLHRRVRAGHGGGRVVLAPVHEPALGAVPARRGRRRDPGVSEAGAGRVAERTADGLCVLGLRFTRTARSRTNASPRSAPGSATRSRSSSWTPPRATPAASAGAPTPS